MIKNKDNSCYVVAGGPSLKDLNFSLLRDKNTITINKSILTVPEPNHFITVDHTLFKQMEDQGSYQQYLDSNATKYFVAQLGVPYLQEVDGRIMDVRDKYVYNLEMVDVILKSRKLGHAGLTFKEFSQGNNSGYAGLQLAVILGYNPIYLLGFDLCVNNDQTHYHDGYGKPTELMHKNLNVFLPYFISFIKDLKDKRPDIDIYSCSSVSPLNEHIPYKQILNLKGKNLYNV